MNFPAGKKMILVSLNPIIVFSNTAEMDGEKYIALLFGRIKFYQVLFKKKTVNGYSACSTHAVIIDCVKTFVKIIFFVVQKDYT